MQTTKTSFRTGRWMTTEPLSADEREKRAPLIHKKRDGTRVWMPLTDRGPRTISVEGLIHDLDARRIMEDDLRLDLCPRLREAITLTPPGPAWDATKRRWGIIGGAFDCPGCRACRQA